MSDSDDLIFVLRGMANNLEAFPEMYDELVKCMDARMFESLVRFTEHYQKVETQFLGPKPKAPFKLKAVE